MPNDLNNTSIFKSKKGVHPQLQAKKLDKRLGFKIPKIEVKLLQKYRAYDKSSDQSNKKKHFDGTQTWVGLHPQALQTPYCDIYEALKIINDHKDEIIIEDIIDIGSGYGRVGHVMQDIFPEAIFLGYEILKQRQREGNRVFDLHNLPKCRIELKNVLDEAFDLPLAQIYFIYDFSELDDLCQILDQLSLKLSSENFFLITRGTRIDFLLEKKYKGFWAQNGFLKHGELKIYSSFVKLI